MTQTPKQQFNRRAANGFGLYVYINQSTIEGLKPMSVIDAADKLHVLSQLESACLQGMIYVGYFAIAARNEDSVRPGLPRD